MSSENRKKAASHLDAFVDDIFNRIAEDMADAEGEIFKKLAKTTSERLGTIEDNLRSLIQSLGEKRDDVAVGNGSLKKFTIPNEKGVIKYTVAGEKIEAQVDDKGNVSGKYIASKNITSSQVEVVLSQPFDQDSTVVFEAGSVSETFSRLQANMEAFKSMQETHSETFVNIQKDYMEKVEAVKSKIDEELLPFVKKVQEIENVIDKKMTDFKAAISKQFEDTNKKVNRINEKLRGIGNIMREEGLSS